MDPALQEWLDLALRWMHAIAGIAWVGTSFFFNWLDARMSPPKRPAAGVEEEMWLAHSGGFYVLNRMNRIRRERPTAIGDEAMATWATGMLLLIVVFYFSANLYLVDPAVAEINAYDAIFIGLTAIVGGWLLYDTFWQTRFAVENQGWAIALSCLALAAVTYFLHQYLSARGAYIHVGVMLGTIMWANVRVRILPAQIRMMRETGPDDRPARELEADAKRRSTHNNYMTLPVVMVMVSGHFPATYGHEQAWLVLLALFAVGAAARHAFNLDNHGRAGKWPLLGVSLAGLAAIALAVSPPRLAGGDPASGPAAVGDAAAMFREVRVTIAEHCLECHSEAPTHPDFEQPPKGVAFDTPREIRLGAPLILKTTVEDDIMPLGDGAAMTDAERALLGDWIAAGARIR